MGPEALAQVLQPLTLRSHPDLIVGLQTSDDAAVFRVSENRAVIQTIDFFTPIVDDPFTYGGIAAANSMSDIYAMGGDVAFALNVVAFPTTLDPSILGHILEGGAAKVEEAGGVIAGGHSVTDAEPKYGLSVTGFVHPDRIWRKGGAKPGDSLLLTKPVGTGIVSTALKNQVASPEHVEASIRSMLTLNRLASETMRAFDIHACTDVTGFGLIGHAWEMASKGDIKIEIIAANVPLLPGVLEFATAGQKPGGLHRNREYYHEQGVATSSHSDPNLLDVLFDPQTSGGLLFAVAADAVPDVVATFEKRGLPLWQIGSVSIGAGLLIIDE